MCAISDPRCSCDVLSDKNLTKPKHLTRDFRADKSVAAPEEMISYLVSSTVPPTTTTVSISKQCRQKEVITVEERRGEELQDGVVGVRWG